MTLNKIEQYRYRIKNTGYSSKRFGNCEVCNQHTSEVFYQVEEKLVDGKWLETGDCKNIFGHEKCLLKLRRLNNEITQPNII